MIDERGGEESDDGGEDVLYRDSEEEEDDSCTEDQEDDEEATLGSTSRGQDLRRKEPRRSARQRRRANTAARTWDELEMPERPFALASGPSLPAGQDFSDPLAVFDLFWKPIRALMKVYTNRYCHLLLSKAVHPAYLDGWKDVSDEDLDVFLAILIFMGIKDMPCEKMYWSQGGVWRSRLFAPT